MTPGFSAAMLLSPYKAAMPQLAGFRPFFSATSRFRLPSPSLHRLVHYPASSAAAVPFSTLCSSFSDRGGGRRSHAAGSPSRQRRGSSTTKEIGMDKEKEGIGFNRKRAEGRDGTSRKNLQLKVRKLNPANTTSYVQILGTGMDTQDTSPSVLLFFDKQRIIFNAGEGLQRFCTEHKIKLSKIDHIFLTRVCSETAGGLPGLLLTLAGIGEEGMSVKIYGPSDLERMVDAMRSFIPNAAMAHTHSFGGTVAGNRNAFSGSNLQKLTDPHILIDDEVVRISAILLCPKYSYGSGTLMTESDTIADEGSSRKKVAASLNPSDIAVIYACELPEIKGKFDPSKAAALGLRPGPKYRDLQLGNSVLSDSQGVMVHPGDVLGPSIPGPIVLLVDCPTASHLQELLSLHSLDCYYTNSTGGSQGTKSVHCVIHLGPATVTNHPDYQKWMGRFGNAQHIMAGHEMKNIELPVLSSSARIAARLNYVCPQLFPAPGFWCSQDDSNPCRGLNPSSEDPSSMPCHSVYAENLLKFHLRPYSHLGLDQSAVPKLLNSAGIINELLLEIPEIADASKLVSQLWHGSKKINEIAYSNNESISMVEEPWMLENQQIINQDPAVQERSQPRRIKSGQELDAPLCLESITRDDMEFVLLGTGSSQPSKYRNVSSIYVNLFAKGSILLDCGEGTLAQLKRRFGVEGADEALKALRLIWISHIHADHHTGLARILALRSQLLKGSTHEPVLVIGPGHLKRFLDAYSRLEDLDMQYLDCRHTTVSSWNAVLDSPNSGENPNSEQPNHDELVENHDASRQNLGNTIFTKCSKMQSFRKQPGRLVNVAAVLPTLNRLKKLLHEAGLESLYSVPVVHCPEAFAIVLKATERRNSVGMTVPGWKLVYSGDTRPCQALIDASHGATVLIHEATFEDGMEEEALVKNHSTTMEAIKVGMSAGAYRTILTHFSQRYPKIPIFDEAHMENTCIAFDMMSINLADLPVLPKVLPYLKLLFKNEMAIDESDEV